MMRNGLELPCYFTSDTDAIENNDKFDIPIPDSSIKEKNVMFYLIDNIKCNGSAGCIISSGMDEYYCTESYEVVIAKICERQNFIFN